MQQQRRAVRRQRLINIAKGLIAVALLIWLVDSGRLDFAILLSAPLSVLHLLGLLALLVNMLLQAVRWWWLLRIQEISLSLKNAFQLSWIGQFFSLVLPGAAGGELARAYYVVRDAPAAKVAGISTVLLDRVLGLYALLWLGISSLLVLAFQNELTSTVMQMGALILLLVISTSVFSLGLWLRSTRNLILSFAPRRFRAPLEATLDSYRGHGKELFGGFTLSLLANIVLMVVFLLSSQIIGTPLKWQQTLLVCPLVIIANSLPISPGGVGVAETTASGLFAQFGVETGAAIMLIVRLGILLLRLPGGGIYVLRTGPWTSTRLGKETTLYRWGRSAYGNVRRSLSVVSTSLQTKKPATITWPDFIVIQRAPIRYQPLLFPNGEIIPRKCAESILDSRDKLAAVGLPNDLTGKTLLDIGCAEGFFVIQAALRGAERVTGCDILESRLRIARIVAKSWQIQDRVLFSVADLYNIPYEWASDIVLCLAVVHHLHGGEHDTWQMISNPRKHAKAVDNMLRAVAAVSSLTKEVTYWEYSFEYEDRKPEDVDHAMLGRLWLQKGLYRKVEFRGLSQSLPLKDRALYRAFK